MVDMFRAQTGRIRANSNSGSGRRYMLTMLLYPFPLVKVYLPLQRPSTSIYVSSVFSCTPAHQAKRARRRPCTVRRGMRSTRLGTFRTSFWIVGARSASLSPSSISGHCSIATYQIIMTWMFESRKPPRPLVRYVIISSVLAI